MKYENAVELLGFYGGDETHALSAWASTKREITDERRGRVGAMLKQLAEAGHHTPFEKSTLHFLVTCDVASHIQLLKHRVGVSVNAESARYREHKEDRYYIPADWPMETKMALRRAAEAAYAAYHGAILELEMAGIERKRAKESARYFLPYATQTTMDVTFNFRSFMHFVKLRSAADAQAEIKDLAKAMIRLVKGTNEFDLSLTAFKIEVQA